MIDDIEEAKNEELKQVKSEDIQSITQYSDHHYVDKNFPFSQGTQEFLCPYWVKCLLYEKYNIKDI
jgi:hypothetical protein